MSKINVPHIPGEIDVFNFINSHHSSFWDSFMFMLSFQYSWIPLLICFFVYVFYKKRFVDGLLLILMLVLCVVIGDQISSGISKPFFARLRPTHFPEIKDYVNTVYGYKGALYGFFSGHACNYVAVISFLSFVIRDKFSVAILCIYGALVCYSRMYLGVHFLSDILVGMAIGFIIGFLVFRLFSLLSRIYLYKSDKNLYRKNIVFFRFSLVMYIVTLFFYSIQVEKIVKFLG